MFVREMPGRPGKWQAIVPAPPDPLTGKRRTKTGLADSEAEALALGVRLEAEVEAGLWRDDNLSVAKLAERWLLTKRKIADSTRDGYQTKLNNALSYIGNQKAGDVSPLQVETLYGRLEADLAPRSILHVHRVLAAMFADAYRWGLIDRDPMLRVRRPDVAAHDADTYDMDSLRRFLDAARDHPWFAVWELAAHRGLRRGELCGLQWDRVDFTSGEVRIDWTRIIVKGRVVEKAPKSAASNRTLAVDEVTLRALADHRRRQAEARLRLGIGGQPRWLIAWEDGSPPYPKTVTAQFLAICRQAGLSRIVLHELRHTAATQQLDAGVPLSQVSSGLGHSSDAFTKATYIHKTPTLDRQLADVMRRRLDGTAPEADQKGAR